MRPGSRLINPANTRPCPGGLTLARLPDGWGYTDVPFYGGVPERYEMLPIHRWADPGDIATVVRHLLAHGPEAIPSPTSARRWSGAEETQAALDKLTHDPHGYDRYA